MINYSIIIPHKNISSLLRRCLDSIPERDDLEIIVVDDNSNEKTIKDLQSIQKRLACTCHSYSVTSYWSLAEI